MHLASKVALELVAWLNEGEPGAVNLKRRALDDGLESNDELSRVPDKDKLVGVPGILITVLKTKPQKKANFSGLFSQPEEESERGD
jgi:hypothetical protein